MTGGASGRSEAVTQGVVPEHGDGRPDDITLRLSAAVEALLVVVDGSLDVAATAVALGVPQSLLAETLRKLAASYEQQGRGFRLRETAAGWRLFAAPEHRELIERLVLDEQPARLTQAALETLAVVAYQQPVSRARVAAIRGVSVDAVMRTLVGRGVVEQVGQDSSTGTILYGTTKLFLERVGLVSLEQLPPLAPLLPDVHGISTADDALSSRHGD